MGRAGERKTTDIEKNPTSAPQRSKGSPTSIHGRVKCTQSLSQGHCWQYRSISTNFVHAGSFEPEEGRGWVPHSTTLGFGSEKWAVFEIHPMGTASRHQEKLVWFRQKEPLVTSHCTIITWLFVPCPGLPPQLAPPSGHVRRRRVLARFYPTMPCHRPDQASHVTWSHL